MVWANTPMNDDHATDTVLEKLGFLTATVNRNTQDITDIKLGQATLRECVTSGHTELSTQIASITSTVQGREKRQILIIRCLAIFLPIFSALGVKSFDWFK